MQEIYSENRLHGTDVSFRTGDGKMSQPRQDSGTGRASLPREPRQILGEIVRLRVTVLLKP